MNIYFGAFKSRDDVLQQFELDENALEGCNILFASYGTGDYEGHGWVLFERDGKLYETNAYHCSCYGLEGQWEPEETEWVHLNFRFNSGYILGSDHDSSAHAALKTLLENNPLAQL